MTEEFIVHTDLIGDAFKPLLDEVKALTGNEERVKAMLQQAMNESQAYFAAYVEKPKKATAKAG
jgi:CRISPR-associated protein Csc2